jgi:hypothetical protein
VSPNSGRTGVVRRRRATFATMVVAAFVVPVAIAYACNPQAHVSLDKTSYQPGSAITVHGSYFTGNSAVTVSGPTGSVGVTTSPGGGFTTTLTAPSTPGTYTITASRPTGGFAPASFSVVAPAAPAAQATQPDAAPAAPAATPARTAPSFREPSVARSQTPASAERQTAPARSTPSSSNTRPGTTSVAGQQVFSGSTAQAAPVQSFAAAPAPAVRPSRSSASRTAPAAATTPVEQAATSDLFSNYQPGRTPSLTGAASGAPAGGAGSGLGLGIALLAFGLLATVAGLTAAEVRRRRPA